MDFQLTFGCKNQFSPTVRRAVKSQRRRARTQHRTDQTADDGCCTVQNLDLTITTLNHKKETKHRTREMHY